MDTLNVKALLAEQGAKLPVCLEFSLEQIAAKSPVFSDASQQIKLTEALRVKGNLINIGDEILRLEADCSCGLEMPCDRCNEPVAVVLDYPVTARFAREDQIEKFSSSTYGVLHQGETDENEASDFEPIVFDRIDLEDLLIYELQLNIPMKVLCKEDCKGLCPACGQNLNISPCGCSLTEHDERWDALKGLFD